MTKYPCVVVHTIIVVDYSLICNALSQQSCSGDYRKMPMSHDHLKIYHTQPSTKPALHGKCLCHNFWSRGRYGVGGGGGGGGGEEVEEGEEVIKVL